MVFGSQALLSKKERFGLPWGVMYMYASALFPPGRGGLEACEPSSDHLRGLPLSQLQMGILLKWL